jgi:peptide deformylase
LRKLADDMLETMYDAPGVGLAANQIGVQKRMFVFDINDGSGPGVIVNPVLSNHRGEWEYTEGCLSVPDLHWPIVRFKEVRVDGLDLDRNPVSIEGDELMSRMLQHEVDHLDGRLLLSHLDRRQYKEAMRALRRRAMGLSEAGDDRESVG